MSLKRDKGGQFYLLAAIVIIALIIGFAAISNVAKKRAQTTIYDLGDELGIESARVLDFGVIRQEEVNNTELIAHFTTLYDQYAGTDKEMYYIFGNPGNIIAYKYGDIIVGTISITIGGGGSQIPIDQRLRQDIGVTEDSTSGKISVDIDGKLYYFDLNQGENFYFVISQNIGGEEFVAIG